MAAFQLRGRPLASTRPYDPSFRVPLAIEEGLWGSGADGPRNTIMALLAQLEMTLKRADILARQNRPREPHVTAQEQELLGRLGAALKRLRGAPALSAFLQAEGLQRLLPRVFMRVVDSGLQLSTKKTPLDSYFLNVTILNQIFVLSQQLQRDVTNLQNHKYIAHQVALLYQCVSQTGDHLLDFKKDIEAHFTKIKQATRIRDDQTAPPKLPKGLARWLHTLADKLLKHLRSLPPGLAAPMDPVAEFLLE